MRQKRWTINELREAAKLSRSIRQILQKLGLREAGGNYSQIKKYLQAYEVNISHLRGRAWNKGLCGIGKPLIPLDKILVLNSNFQSHKLKKRLFASRLKEECCEKCGWSKKSEDGRLPLELDHINGNSRDNRLENLRILCPNCHSLQLTHRGRNINSTYARVVER